MIKILSKCSPSADQVRRHPMVTCGLGLKKDKIEEFHREFERQVKLEIAPDDLVDSIAYDGSVELSELDDRFFEMYDNLSPFGHGNSQPSYRLNSVEIVRTFPIKAGHTRGILRDSSGANSDFIAFNMILEPRSHWDLIVIPQINEYYGERRKQLQIVDMHPLG
jgi:single-stranded-DNA-specific exonuclease